MPYSTNPHLPKVRRAAVNFVLSGHSTREAARHFGYSQPAIVQWIKRAPGDRRTHIPANSGRPWHHPRELSEDIINRIIEIRGERKQCAEIIHHRLSGEGVVVSLSSVKRTLKRLGLAYPSKWKKWRQYPDRPLAEKPGIFAQIDSMQDGVHSDCLHAYALIDVFSRWGYVEPIKRISTHNSFHFINAAQIASPFSFQTIQSDHGAEFSKWFTKKCLSRGLQHCHSRVRKPTDNAFVERFIQTLQKQCLDRIPRTMKAWKKEMPEFLR